MSTHIRFARPEDAPVLLRFIRELAIFEREPNAVEATASSLAAQLRAQPAPFECLLAFQAEQAVGFALFYQTYSTWKGRPGMHLEDLFVSGAARGQGIGEALLRALAELSNERGYGRMEWAVLNWNAGAIDFYERLGAAPLSEWTTYRLEGEALANMKGGTPG